MNSNNLLTMTGLLSRFASAIVLALLLIAPARLDAQKIAIGIRGYAQITDAIVADPLGSSNGLSVLSHPYAFGPTVEVGLPRGIAIQVDAIRSRLEYSRKYTPFDPSSFSREYDNNHTTGHSWQFPLIAKKYIHAGRIFRFYPEIGVSVQHVDAVTNFVSTRTGTQCPISCGTTVLTGSFSPAELARKWSTGIVLGGGIDVTRHHVHIQPELRYTGWLQSAFNEVTLLHSNKNSPAALIGITVGK